MIQFVRSIHSQGEVLKINQTYFWDQDEKVELDYLSFPALEKTGKVSHLFSTRSGGVSEGIYSKMNLSFSRGDDPEHVRRNFERIARVLHCKTEDFVFSKQTHTTNIRHVTSKDRGKGIVKEMDYTDVDGLITEEKGIVLSTFFADCVPLFFVDTKRDAIGLAHSGWRGTVARMGACMVNAMRDQFGSDPQDLIAAIGPSICRDCYEVSEDVAEKFIEEFGEDVCTPGRESGKYQLDVWLANRYVCEQAGIPSKQISVTDICTCHNADVLFSHRASLGKRGNLGAFMMLNQ